MLKTEGAPFKGTLINRSSKMLNEENQLHSASLLA
jgi:hypothetical protein